MPDMSAAGLPHTLVEVLMAALSQAVPKGVTISNGRGGLQIFKNVARVIL